MKSVLISIKPKWCHRIIDGEKTIEVRKTKPKLDVPFKCYIYCTAGDYEWKKDCWATAYQTANGSIENMPQMVIGEFVCDTITKYPYENYNDGEHLMPSGDLEKTCFDGFEIFDYLGVNDGYGWHISDLKIYDKPKELSEFYSLSYQKKCGYCVYLCDSYPHCVLKQNRKPMTRPPQSWCYVEEVV